MPQVFLILVAYLVFILWLVVNEVMTCAFVLPKWNAL